MPRVSDLVDRIHRLQTTILREQIERKIRQFRTLGRFGTDDEVFSELCFCILTANSQAKVGVRIQRDLGQDAFLRMPERELANRLRCLGQRFYKIRAKYIVEAREFRNIRPLLARFSNPVAKRDWLSENILGISYKEGSHFLRNIGELDVAILDLHVIRILNKYRVLRSLKRPSSRKAYLSAEKRVRTLSNLVGMPMGYLDLYLWHMETGELYK